MTDTELTDLHLAVAAERQRRQRLSKTEADIRDIIQANQTDREDGNAWEQPYTLLTTYLRGAVVEHDGKTWVSTTDLNSHAPGVSGWREQLPDGQVPEYLQPTGTHDAYRIGEQVMFQGKTYESTLDYNVWNPTDNPASWKLIGEETPDIPDFVQPTGSHDSYSIDDIIMFEGEIYKSLINGNTWSPTDYPSGWQHIPAP